MRLLEDRIEGTTRPGHEGVLNVIGHSVFRQHFSASFRLGCIERQSKQRFHARIHYEQQARQGVLGKEYFFQAQLQAFRELQYLNALSFISVRAYQSLKKIFLFLRSTLTRLGGHSPTNRALKNMHHKTVLKCNGCARFENYFVPTNGPDLGSVTTNILR